MKTICIIPGLLLLGFLITRCTMDNEVKAEKALASMPAQNAELTTEMKIKRGEYLVNAIGCDDCHSPKTMGPNGPEIDPERRMSGHPSDVKVAEISDKKLLQDFALCTHDLTAWVGPWGTSFAANLTPDDTGIGNWTEEQFIKCLREGKLKGLDGSRPLLPPMPWFVYKNLTDDDLKSIFAYLKTMKPVNNVVPAPIMPAG